MKKRIDLQKLPELLEAMNRELEAGNPVELRVEQDNLVLVRLGRTVKMKIKSE